MAQGKVQQQCVPLLVVGLYILQQKLQRSSRALSVGFFVQGSSPTSGSSTASGPNTVKVLPEPDKPYANNTTALPVSRSALIFIPTDEYTYWWEV